MGGGGTCVSSDSYKKSLAGVGTCASCDGHQMSQAEGEGHRYL